MKKNLQDVSIIVFELDRMTKEKKQVKIDQNVEKILNENIQKLIQVYDIDPKFYFHRCQVRHPYSTIDYKSLESTSFDTKHKGRINKILIEEQQKRLILVGDDSKIEIYDLDSKKLLRANTAHKMAINDIVRLQSGEYVTCSNDKTIKVWKLGN